MISGAAAIEREVGPLALDRERLGHAPVEQDVAAREERPRRRGIECLACRRVGQPRPERPVGRVGQPIDPEQGLVAPGERPDLRPDGVGTQEGEPLAVLGEVGGELRGVPGLDESRGIGRTLDAERGEDRVRLALDQLEGVVARAGAGEDRGELLLRRGEDRGAEACDRHDRDIREGRRGDRGRFGSRVGIRGRRRRRLGTGGGKDGARTGRGRDCKTATGRCRRTRTETELAALDGQRDGQRQQGEDDECRAPLHGPDCDRGARDSKRTRPTTPPWCGPGTATSRAVRLGRAQCNAEPSTRTSAPKAARRSRAANNAALVRQGSATLVPCAGAVPGQGGAEYRSERTPRCVSEETQATTPPCAAGKCHDRAVRRGRARARRSRVPERAHPKVREGARGGDNAALVRPEVPRPCRPARPVPVQGGGEHESERTPRCVSERAQPTTPQWGRTSRSANRERPVRAGGRGVGKCGLMADPTGFEPAISSVTGWHVGPLHHGSRCGEGGA